MVAAGISPYHANPVAAIEGFDADLRYSRQPTRLALLPEILVEDVSTQNHGRST
jgi:hypothetical protein